MRRVVAATAVVLWVGLVGYSILIGRRPASDGAEGRAFSVLSVTTDPAGAAVRLGREGSERAFVRGTTPCDLLLEVPDEGGRVRLDISKPGFLPQRLDVRLTAAQSESVAVALEPLEQWKPDEQPRRTHPVTIAAVGDIRLGQVRDPFGEVGDLLRSSDVTFGNLECALTTSVVHTPGKTDAQVQQQKQFVFRAHPRWSNALALGGFDVLSMANNHAMDYQAEGLRDSVDSLSRLGLKVVGAGPTLAHARARREVTVGGVKVGFLAVTTIVPDYFPAAASSPGVAAHPAGPMAGWLRDAIAGASDSVDVLCVSFHWGIERQPQPAEYQRSLVRTAVEAGADFIIGHHPHCLQPIEVINGALVAYSLGNFVGLGTDASTQASVILRARFEDGRLSSYETFPVKLVDHRPQLDGPGQRFDVTGAVAGGG